MITHPDAANPRRRTADASSIRSQAVWALIAAITLLYFGFNRMVLDEESLASQLLIYTLKCGGIAMVVSAVLLALGVPIALLLDGVFSMLVGVGLALAGALWALEVHTLTLDTILELIFGYLFFTGGLRNFREFVRLGQPSSFGDTPAADSHASADATAPAGTRSIPPLEAYDTSSHESRSHSSAPEGYLASFADKDDNEDNHA